MDRETDAGRPKPPRCYKLFRRDGVWLRLLGIGGAAIVLVAGKEVRQGLRLTGRFL